MSVLTILIKLASFSMKTKSWYSDMLAKTIMPNKYKLTQNNFTYICIALLNPQQLDIYYYFDIYFICVIVHVMDQHSDSNPFGVDQLLG